MPAFGHVPKERVDCKSPEVCSVCDMVLSEEPRHIFVTYAPVQPTFFESAIYNYGECQFCGEYMTRPPEILPSYFEQYFYVILSSSILLFALLVVVPIVAVSRRKKKKALLRAAEFGHWESKSRR
jgi:hypothetical protein